MVLGCTTHGHVSFQSIGNQPYIPLIDHRYFQQVTLVRLCFILQVFFVLFFGGHMILCRGHGVSYICIR